MTLLHNSHPLILFITFKYTQLEEELEGAQELFEAGDDAEMREMARSEIKEITEKLEELESTIKILLLPKDPNDDRNCMLEIRAGTGGSEANIFAGEISTCYLLLCHSHVQMKYIVAHFDICHVISSLHPKEIY